MRYYTTFVILIAAMSATPAHSAVFERDWLAPGDGLLTYDDVNQREWLDLTETQLFQFPGDSLEERFFAILAETAPGGRFAEFTVANNDDVSEFVRSAGINTEEFAISVNGQETSDLIGLVGEAGSASNPTRNRISSALAMEPDSPILVESIVFAPGGLGTRPGPPVAGFYSSSAIADDGVGVWLYRSIPEPGTWSLVLSALVLAFSRRHRT